MSKTITIYEPGDLLTADAAADHSGYPRDYFRAMLAIGNKAADPRLIRLKIATDATWKKAHGSRAHFVFEYEALKAWYLTRNRRSTVKAKADRRTKSPSLIL